MKRNSYTPYTEWVDCRREPAKDDKYWKDARGKLHHIEHMDARYAEACIRVCHANGSEIPDALMTRWRGRHKDNTAVFAELNND